MKGGQPHHGEQKCGKWDNEYLHIVKEAGELKAGSLPSGER
jgi:hypothetical protein